MMTVVIGFPLAALPRSDPEGLDVPHELEEGHPARGHRRQLQSRNTPSKRAGFSPSSPRVSRTTPDAQSIDQTVIIRLDGFSPEGAPPPPITTCGPGRETWAPEGMVAYSKVCTHAGCPGRPLPGADRAAALPVPPVALRRQVRGRAGIRACAAPASAVAAHDRRRRFRPGPERLRRADRSRVLGAEHHMTPRPS